MSTDNYYRVLTQRQNVPDAPGVLIKGRLRRSFLKIGCTGISPKGGEMDTSETYIKMCGKAEEIQTSGFAPQGSFLLHPLPEHIKVLTIWQHQYSGEYSRYDLALDHSGHYWIIPPIIKPCIWLPRQDQLQEMIGLPTWKLVYEFSLWFSAVMEVKAEPIWKQYSMEQLWLAFVMKEKYSKIWNGEDWVK